MIHFILALASFSFATTVPVDPCSLFKIDEGNAVQDDDRGLHREQCFGFGATGELLLNNRDAYVAGGQNKEAGDFQARNSAYVVLYGRTPLRQWGRYRADTMPDVALNVITDDGGTPDYPFDDLNFVNVGSAVNAPADILALIGARKVTTQSGSEVMAAATLRPGSVGMLSTKGGEIELVVIKFTRQSDSEVFSYTGKKTIMVDTQDHPGFELYLAAVGGWPK